MPTEDSDERYGASSQQPPADAQARFGAWLRGWPGGGALGTTTLATSAGGAAGHHSCGVLALPGACGTRPSAVAGDAPLAACGLVIGEICEQKEKIRSFIRTYVLVDKYLGRYR